MIESRVMEFKDWLMEKFLEWEKQQTRRQTYSSFSRYLGIKQNTFSQWMAGNYVPSRENADQLANRLGNEIYEVLGMKAPDPIITAIEELEKSSDPEAIKVRKSIFDLLSSTGWLRTK